MLLLAFAMLTATPQALQAQQPPNTLMVQLVDEVWMPLPSLVVEILRPKGKERLRSQRTDQRGYAGFSIEAGTYLVRVPAESGFAEESVSVRLVPATSSQPTAYVQLRLTKYKDKPVSTHPR